MKPTNEQINAIRNCDSNYDNLFFYGVKSTRIFCKPSCKSRMPKLTNIEIAESAEALEKMGFHPCKRCRPTNIKMPDVEWIDHVIAYLEENYAQKLTLTIIAEETHSSPYHLHRKFKEIRKTTIHTYIRQLRMNEALYLLMNSSMNVADIGRKVGINDPSQFSRDFKITFGKSAQQMRKEIIK